MFEYFRYRRALYKLARSRRRTIAAFSEDKRAARADQKSWADVRAILDREHFEVQTIDDEMGRVHSNFYMECARKRVVPVPDFQRDSPNWTEVHGGGMWYLSPAAITDIRAKLRAERRESTDLFFRWVTIIIGFMGAAIGLISMMKK